MEVFHVRTLPPSRDMATCTRWKSWHMNDFLLDFTAACPSRSLRRSSRGGGRLPRFYHRSKKSVFQDFQGFAEPSKLLPVTTAKFCTGLNLKEILAFSKSKMSSLYIVQFCTSNAFGSGLMDSNAAILFSLIDIDGNSVLQRISAELMEDLSSRNDMSSSQETRFQRGSVDMITFQGPEIGKVNAVWIGLESGSWRVSNVSLVVIDSKGRSGLGRDPKEVEYSGLRYDFEANGILLGEKDGASITELRPKSIMDFPMDQNPNLASMPFPSLKEQTLSGEESMKDYTNLKLSSLIYDAIIVSAGSSAFSASMDEKTASVFLFGGLCGFVYLLLLQKSVDGLSASTVFPAGERRKSVMEVLRGFKGSFAMFALILASSAAAFKYGLESSIVGVTPLQFLLGVLGFSTSRIAVLLAAFKPLEAGK